MAAVCPSSTDRAGGHPAATAASAATCASAGPSRWRTRASASASFPTRVFRLTCDTDYPAPVGRQSLELEVTPERYASELAFARTFGWQNDLDQMRNMGLIRGAIAGKRGLLHPRRRPEPRRPARPRRMLPPQGARPDRRPRAARPSAAGSRHRRTRRTRHACGAGGAHHERPVALRDHHLRPAGVARHPGPGFLGKFSGRSRM